MNKQDKVMAIAGIVLIIILAIIAVFLLFKTKNNSIISVKPVTETIELTEQADEVKVEKDGEEEIVVESADETTDLTGVSASVQSVPKSKTEINEKYTKSTCKKVMNNDVQLAELADYWEQYHLEAVGDLIRLERIRAFSKDLAGTNQFYYYGEVDANKLPNGRGLAVYENDTYYYGDWSKGLRDGNGMWLRIYIGEPGVEGKYAGILEHQYNGQFKNDLPNGTGQEHYSINMDLITYDTTILNAIGDFKNGYYDGDMYFMTGDTKGNKYDWYAKATSGVFSYCVLDKVSTTNKRPVWVKGEDNDHSTDESDDGYLWMSDEENKSFGIYGLKK